MKNHHYAKRLGVAILAIVFTVIISVPVMAAGLYGPMQTVSRQQGGLNTSIGYFYHADAYQDIERYAIKQNQFYMQAAYGSKNIWEAYARLGVSDMAMTGIFASVNHYVTTSKDNFESDWIPFGSLGGKVFYPINAIFGVGAVVQGTYYFDDFSDTVAITSGGMPVRTEIEVKRLWDINFGVGAQASLPRNIQLYAGPYLYYSEAKMSRHSGLHGIGYGSQDETIENKTKAGLLMGADIPLIKGFRLNLEGRLSDKFSAGFAVSYTY